MKGDEYKIEGLVSDTEGIPIANKNKIYFSCHPDDSNKYFNIISKEIRSCIDDDCIIFCFEPNTAFSEEDRTDVIKEMQLIVIPITAKLLLEDSVAMNFDLPLAKKLKIPVLPLMQENNLEAKFNSDERFCQMQFLDKNNTDSTAISYETKLKNFLSSVLLADFKKSREEIKSAFNTKIFLSYRKKDRAYANELIALIHKDPLLQKSVSIWYDEYLTPGENFNKEIENAIDESDLFLLAITPNINEKDNYVMTEEYPKAKEKYKEKVIPVEMTYTDITELKENYLDIPNIFYSTRPNALCDNLLKFLTAQEIDDSPQHLYLLGLAYLNGVGVEINREYAFNYIKDAAENDLPDAIEKMVDLYHYSYGVSVEEKFTNHYKNHYEAIKWQKKLVDHYKNNKSENVFEKLIESLKKLSDLYSESNDFTEATDVLIQVENLLEPLRNSENVLWELLEIKINLAALCSKIIENPNQIKTFQKYSEILEIITDNYNKTLNDYQLKLIAEFIENFGLFLLNKPRYLDSKLATETLVFGIRKLRGYIEKYNKISFNEAFNDSVIGNYHNISENFFDEKEQIVENIINGNINDIPIEFKRQFNLDIESVDNKYKYHLGSIEKAINFFDDLKNNKLDINSNTRSEIIEDIERLINNQCNNFEIFKTINNMLFKVEELFLISLNIFKYLYNRNKKEFCIPYGRIQGNIASLWCDLGEYKKAITMYEQNINFLEQSQDGFHLDLTPMLFEQYINISRIHNIRNNQVSSDEYLSNMNLLKFIILLDNKLDESPQYVYYAVLSFFEFALEIKIFLDKLKEHWKTQKFDSKGLEFIKSKETLWRATCEQHLLDAASIMEQFIQKEFTSLQAEMKLIEIYHELFIFYIQEETFNENYAIEYYNKAIELCKINLEKNRFQCNYSICKIKNEFLLIHQNWLETSNVVINLVNDTLDICLGLFTEDSEYGIPAWNDTLNKLVVYNQNVEINFTGEPLESWHNYISSIIVEILKHIKETAIQNPQLLFTHDFRQYLYDIKFYNLGVENFNIPQSFKTLVYKIFKIYIEQIYKEMGINESINIKQEIENFYNELINKEDGPVKEIFIKEKSELLNLLEPATNEKEFVNIRRRYDIQGNTIEEAYYDVNGELSVDNNGVAIKRYGYDVCGNKIIELYFGVDGEPIMDKNGVSILRQKYDEYGNIIEYSYYDTNNELTLSKNGYARISCKYNEFSKLTEKSYYGVDGTLVTDSYGVSTKQYKYDKWGCIVEVLFFYLVKHKDDFSILRHRYDEHGNVIEYSYYDKNNEPVLNKDGYASIRCKYDDIGKIIEKSYYGLDGEPTFYKGGYAIIRWKYDEKGNIVEYSYYDQDNKPVLSNYGYASIRCKYNEVGKLTEESYYGLDGEPAVDTYGVSTKQHKYNGTGIKTETTFFYLETQKDGFSILRHKYNEHGNKIEQSYYGVDGNLLLNKNGYAIIRWKYDEKGMLIDQKYFDVDDKDITDIVNAKKG